MIYTCNHTKYDFNTITMAYKMKGSKFYGKGNQSPLKQDYKVLNDEELEESRKRMNSRIDAIEDIKSMSNEKGQAEDYMATGEKEAIAQINKQLKNKPVQGVNEPGKLPDLKAIEKIKNWKKGDKIKDLIKT